MQHVLGMAGLDYKKRQDLKPVYADATNSADQIKDGHINWAHFPLGIPGSRVIDLALTGKIDILPIEELKDMAYAETGIPEKLDLGEEIVGMTKWIDGTVLDIIKELRIK